MAFREKPQVFLICALEHSCFPNSGSSSHLRQRRSLTVTISFDFYSIISPESQKLILFSVYLFHCTPHYSFFVFGLHLLRFYSWFYAQDHSQRAWCMWCQDKICIGQLQGKYLPLCTIAPVPTFVLYFLSPLNKS